MILLHEDFVAPVLGDEEISSYLYDSNELSEILNSVLYTLELCRDNNIFFEDETEKIEEMLEMPREDIIVLIPGKNISSVALGKISEVFTSKETVFMSTLYLPVGIAVCPYTFISLILCSGISWERPLSLSSIVSQKSSPSMESFPIV
jgi:hypothetical protein